MAELGLNLCYRCPRLTVCSGQLSPESGASGARHWLSSNPRPSLLRIAKGFACSGPGRLAAGERAGLASPPGSALDPTDESREPALGAPTHSVVHFSNDAISETDRRNSRRGRERAPPLGATSYARELGGYHPNGRESLSTGRITPSFTGIHARFAGVCTRLGFGITPLKRWEACLITSVGGRRSSSGLPPPTCAISASVAVYVFSFD
jgi:hypothetical protein